MSLINQMLRDLEERRADDLARQNLQREIRPLPPGPSAVGLKPLIGLVMAGVLAVAGWQAYEYRAALLPPPAPVPVAAPPVTVAVPPPQLPPDAMLPREIEAPAGVDGLRLTPNLQNVPVDAQLPPPAAAIAQSVVEPKSATNAPEVPKTTAVATVQPVALAKAAVTPAKVVAETSAVPASVEKSTSQTTPRERAEAEYRKAQAAAANGKVAETVEALQAALHQDANHIPARQALIRALLETRRVDEAEVVLREGVELQPVQIGWAMTLARLQVEKNDLPAALKTLGRSAANASRSADYQGFYGHIEHRLGHNREAVALYQSATRLAPGEGRWWLGLGLALESDGQGADAREAFRKALATGNLGPELVAIAESKSR